MTPRDIIDLRQQKYNATVVRLSRINPDLMTLRIRPDNPRPAHKPGQYALLGLGFWEPRVPGSREEELQPGDEIRMARRAYSISCPVLDDSGALLDADSVDWLEFYIVLVRDSEKAEAPALTPRLFMLREGERLFMGEKITGGYTLDSVGPDDAVVFLSTGTGEAPHNYMLWELLRRGHPANILSACCVRYRRDLGYTSTHEELMRRYPHYKYLALTTREPGQGSKRYIQDLITSGELEERLARPLDPASTHVFLCGNPKMIGVPDRDRESGEKVYPKPAGVVEMLEARGFRADQPHQKIKGNIHFEEYW
jgi:ferredoxin/flavodoxin---NADP+ reductase